jgi:hypothetical protein
MVSTIGGIGNLLTNGYLLSANETLIGDLVEVNSTDTYNARLVWAYIGPTGALSNRIDAISDLKTLD